MDKPTEDLKSPVETQPIQNAGTGQNIPPPQPVVATTTTERTDSFDIILYILAM